MQKTKVILEDAIKLLKENYNEAMKYDYIQKPLSWALYHTWDEISHIEKKKAPKEETK